MKTTNFKNESGFTLLELLLVIGVAALLLIGGIATYRLVSEGNKATEATRMLLTLKQEALVLAQQSDDGYQGITKETLVAVGALRSETQLNPYNGAIEIAGAADNMTITFSNITRAGCIKLMTAINNPNEVISVNGQQPPISPATATTSCAEGNGNNIAWVFP